MRTCAILTGALGCLIALVPRTAFSSNVAFDTAGDSAYNNGWTTGSNGGYGWGGGWSLSSSDYLQPPIVGISADPVKRFIRSR